MPHEASFRHQDEFTSVFDLRFVSLPRHFEDFLASGCRRQGSSAILMESPSHTLDCINSWIPRNHLNPSGIFIFSQVHLTFNLSFLLVAFLWRLHRLKFTSTSLPRFYFVFPCNNVYFILFIILRVTFVFLLLFYSWPEQTRPRKDIKTVTHPRSLVYNNTHTPRRPAHSPPAQTPSMPPPTPAHART